MNILSHIRTSGFERAGDLLKRGHPELLVSKQKLRQAEAIQLVRLKRDNVNQNLGFASRPFVLCGLPIKRPAKGVLLHERRNGQFLLQVTGHPTYGVPWGQDRLVPIFLATLAMRRRNRPLLFAALPKCSTSSGCSRAVRSIGGSSPPFSAYLVPPYFSVPIRNISERWLRIRHGSISCVRRVSGIRVIRTGFVAWRL